MMTYSMQPFGAFINSGFKMIFPLGVQLPQRVGMSRNTIELGVTLYFLNLSTKGPAIA